MIICVPARNEAGLLPQLLSAIAGQSIGANGMHLCLYLDDCRDGSRDMLDRMQPVLPFGLTVAQGTRDTEPNAGAARRAALAMGLERLAGAEGLIFTTDADSMPHRDWIAAGCRALQEADVVAGRILRLDAARDPLQCRIERYYDRLHRYRRLVDPVPWEARDTHHFGGGANIAVRASAYRAIGGFRPLPSGEDARFLDDAARAGFRVRRDGAMAVDTSSRRDGRVAGGLADVLRALDHGEWPSMADPRGSSWQWRAQAAARRSFATIDQIHVRTALGESLGLSADHILGVARDCPNGEAFAMRIVPAPMAHDAMVSLATAEDRLGELESRWCEVAA
ncbi:glycosyltransferase [Sphingomonas parapaucimobilis]|uniref:Uncharacterized protein n=1 Tax=Sphingomonas parapaucimobilis NBRC 15100 TaxID=1219049 RepID=A0A0A1W9I6_9SPHN|nr:glycosyltransferase [Sphingomonas parapaucimobilis]GAM02120.1 hypothetical protein SP5_073_00480 [Sphingomonas parapaucimobilis NBRC 15100]